MKVMLLWNGHYSVVTLPVDPRILPKGDQLRMFATELAGAAMDLLEQA